MIVSDEVYQRLQPKKAIREELGVGYFYRCPWLDCNKIVRSDMRFCPACGQHLMFELDSYTKEYYK